jgi:hypothetical protein
MHEPSPLKTWPDVPTRVYSVETIGCSRRRSFAASRRSVWVSPDEIDGGHTPALSRPKELVERLEAYRASIVRHDPDARSQGDVS